MKKTFKALIAKLFNFIFKEQLQELQAIEKAVNTKAHFVDLKTQKLNSILEGIDISVDTENSHPRYCRSWAVISIQGKREDFIKFIDLSSRDINEIRHFLRRFDRKKIDANVPTSAFLKIKNYWE